MLSNRNEWWVPGKIVEVRHRLKGYWQVRLARACLPVLVSLLAHLFRACIAGLPRAVGWAGTPGFHCACCGEHSRQCLTVWARCARQQACVSIPCYIPILSFSQAEGASRDLLLLDIALDGYFRLLVERMDKGAMQGEHLRPAL